VTSYKIKCGVLIFSRIKLMGPCSVHSGWMRLILREFLFRKNLTSHITLRVHFYIQMSRLKTHLHPCHVQQFSLHLTENTTVSIM
jgi:hypothetical protein